MARVLHNFPIVLYNSRIKGSDDSKPGIGYLLSPAYDMVASALVVEGDEEERVARIRFIFDMKVNKLCNYLL